MKENRKKQAEQKKREKSLNILSDAIKARKARNELQKLENSKQKNNINDKMFANLYGNTYVDNYISSYLDLISKETEKKTIRKTEKTS